MAFEDYTGDDGQQADDGGESNDAIYQRYQRGDLQPAGETGVSPGQQEPNWTAVATSMPTWNQGDEIDLQRLTNGASYVRNQAMSGRWGPETVDSITSQLNQQLGPMMQRKAQAEQFQQQQQVNQALHQNALTQGIRAADMKAQAATFPETIHELYNPNTGGIDRYIPDGKGGWQIQEAQDVLAASQSRAGGGEGGGEGGGDAGGADIGPPAPTQDQGPMAPDGKPYGDQPRYRPVTGEDGVTRQQRIPSRAEYEAMQNATPEQQVAIADRIARGTFGAANPLSTGGGGFTGTIQNGPYRDQFAGGGLTQTNRPPAPPPAPAPQAGSPADFHRQAMDMVGPPPAQFYRGAHGQQMPNPAYSRWAADVRATAADLHKEHRQQISLAARDKLEDQREQNRQSLLQQRQDYQEHQKAQTEKANAWDTMYRHHVDKLQEEWDKMRHSPAGGFKEIAPEDRPPEFQNRQAMEREAENRADADWKRGHGGALPESRQVALRQRQAADDADAADRAKKLKLTPEEQALYKTVRLEHGAAHAAAQQAGNAPPAPPAPPAAPMSSRQAAAGVPDEARRIRQLLGLE